MKPIYLSVIIPCYNEERNLRLGALENVAAYLRKQTYDWEVLVMDDGSTDESLRLIKAFMEDHPGFYLHHRRHQGKAAAVTAGVLEASGKYIIFTDMDQATPINQLDRLLPWFSRGYDIVIGSRNNKRRGAPFLRLLMAKGFIMMRNLILDLGIRDTQCGFKAFTRVAARDIFPKLQVFSPKRQAHGSTVTAGFDVEVLYLSKLTGYKIAEVPVEWHYQETRHVSPLRDSLESLLDLIKIRFKSMKDLYAN